MSFKVARKSIRIALVSVFVFGLVSVLLWGNLRSKANKKAASPAAVAAPITVVKSGALAAGGDVNGNGVVNKGDTLEYTVVVSNGATDATGVVFTDALNGNLTLVPGSIRATPVAGDDSYSSIGNTGITVPDGASDLLANDGDPDGGTFSITTAPTTSTQGGTVSINTTTGAFTYNPPVGFEGTDTFNYTITDNHGLTGTGTVTITVSGMLWFVQAGAPAGGDGRLNTPFNCFVGAGCFSGTALDEAGDNIFIYSGSYTGGQALLNNQRLIGQGASTALAGAGSITGITVPTFSNTLPSTGGTNPTITTTNVTAVTLGQGNTIRGLTIGNTGTGSKILGNTFGTLTVGNNAAADVTLNGTGKALDLINGTFAATSAFSSVTTTSSGTQGILLSSVAGTVAFGSTTVSGSTTQGILVQQSTANINFGATTVGTATAGSGGTDCISLQNNSAGTRTFGSTFMTNCTGIGFLHAGGGGAVTAGNIQVTNSAGTAFDIQNSTTQITFNDWLAIKNTSAGTGVNLANNSGNILALSLGILTSNGAALVSANSTGTLTITNTTNSLIANSGPAINITAASGSTPIDIKFFSISSTNSPSGGIILSRTSGAGISTNTTTTITNPATNGISASRSSSTNLNFNTTTITGSGAAGVALGTGGSAGNTGNVTFGQLSITPDAGQRALIAQDNTGTITSTSGAISTTNQIAVEITGTSAASRTPLNMTFTEIDSTGAVSGIILTNTSTSSNVGFRVVGNGGTCNTAVNCTGGAIQNTTGAGIALTNANNVSLTRMYIANTGSHGVNGTGMADGSGGATPTFAFLNGFMESPGDADNESALYFDTLSADNILGTMTVSDSTIQNFEDVGIHVGNTSGTLTVNITNMLIKNNSDTNGEEGIDIESTGTAVINANVSNSRFEDLEGGGMNIFLSSGSGTIDMNIDNNVIIGTGGPDEFPTPPAMTFSAEGTSSNLFFDITNNTIVDNSTVSGIHDGIFIGHEGEMMGRITGNTITGSDIADGIRIDTDATGNQTATIQISNNNLGTLLNFETVNYTGIQDQGIQILHRDGTKTLNLTVSNNQIANTSVSGAGEAFRYFVDDDVSGGGPTGNLAFTGNTLTNIAVPDAVVIIAQDPGTEVCANISGNNLSGTANKNILFQQSLSAILRIPQASVAAVATANTSATSSSFGTITTGVTCSVPLPTNSRPATSGKTDNDLSFLNPVSQSSLEMLASIPFNKYSDKTKTTLTNETVASVKSDNRLMVESTAFVGYKESAGLAVSRSLQGAGSGNFTNTLSQVANALYNGISFFALPELIPTSHAQKEVRGDTKTPTTEAGETVTVNGAGSGFNLPANKSTTITFRATISSSTSATSVSNTANVTADGGINVNSNTVNTAIIQPPTFTKSFDPSSIALNGSSVLTFNINNPNSTNLTGVSIIDNFPSGMVGGPSPSVIQTTNCGGSQVTDQSGFSYGPGDTGVRINNVTAVNGVTCVIRVRVSGTTLGDLVNTTNAITSTNGGTGLTATATLSVVAAPSFTKNFGAPTVPLNGTTTLSFNIINNSSTTSLTGVSFTDSLPAGLVVGTPNNITGSCGGGTITATAGSGTVQLSGATLPVSNSCSFTVDVKGTTSGTKNNSVDLVTNQTGTGPTATANLDVLACTPNPVVTNNNDSGAGSLRDAVAQACSGDTITFSGVISPISISGGQITIDKNITIQGPGANQLTVQNTAAAGVNSRAFLMNSGTVTISGLTISGGNSPGFSGGGIFKGNGTLTVINSTISDNTTHTGGGIANASGTLNVINSTISGNSAVPGGGGGIFNFDGTVNVINSTISGNSAGDGGGITLSSSSSSVNIINSTITGNTAITRGGGIANGGTGTSRNSIIAGNTSGNGPDIFGPLTSQGYNLIGDTNGLTLGTTATDITNVNPRLGPLANNGGPTRTHKLLPNSPAIDKGAAANNPVTSNPITTDQRGSTRPVDLPSVANAASGDGSDIGAFEAQTLPVKVPLDFDGDGKSDYAVIQGVFPRANIKNEKVKDVELSGDLLADDNQRFWTSGYNKLLHLRAGRGFVTLPEDVQAAQLRWKQQGREVYNNQSTEGLPIALNWLIRRSSDGTTLNYSLGTNTDVFVPADYDGDGKTDAAVWNSVSGFTVILSSNLSTVNYPLGAGNMNADPSVVGDYDGDGLDDPAVYDSATGVWSWLGGATHTTVGSATWLSGGIPAPGDYNGDGKMDFAIQIPPGASPDSAKFRIAYNDGSVGPAADLSLTYGLAVYAIVPGDYDGDGKCDIAQANLTGTTIGWRVLTSSSNYTLQIKRNFGAVSTDRTVQGDYDGDGKVDMAIYRRASSPADGVFIVFQSSTNTQTAPFDWGDADDYPVGFFNSH